MKKIILALALVVSTIAIGQEKDTNYPQDIDKKHEVKLNAISLIGNAWFDVSYEYLINEESSFGTSILFSFNNNEDHLSDYFKTFSLTSYYRRYFSSKYARGFFVEGFGMLNTHKDFDLYLGSSNISETIETDFALGVSVGGKFISKRGFSTEIYLGLGRNLFQDHFLTEIVTRGGISLGYRF